MPIWGWVVSGLVLLWAVIYLASIIVLRRQRRHYEEHGKNLIGWILQANSSLYSSGGIDKPAQILVAFDAVDPNDQLMRELVSRITDLKEAKPTGAAEVEVAQLLKDETYRPFERFRLPIEFTGGREVYSMHIWVERSKLPDGVLRHPFVRCLVLLDEQKSRPLMVEYQPGDEK